MLHNQLERALGEVSIENDPDYVPEKDPKILEAVEAWKNK
jgi:hypothetical protein